MNVKGDTVHNHRGPEGINQDCGRSGGFWAHLGLGRR